jgi:membrane-associated phospholipid phosphatase
MTSNLKAPQIIRAALLVLSLSVFTHYTPAQTAPSASPTPQPSPTPSLEKKLLVNILRDQRAIWTSPLHLRADDAKWLAPLGITAAALIATDQRSTNELIDNGDNQTRLDISHGISQIGAAYTTAGIAATFYLVGRVEHNGRARETGLLGAEALIDGGIVSSVLKLATQRPRPQYDQGRGNFRDDGNSFPSGHATATWALATVVADEYHGHPWVVVSAYGLATAVSVARYTGRNHFLSDALVGSAIGYGIGHYVYRKHHDASLDITEAPASHEREWSKLFPLITPHYLRGARTYAATLVWSF